MHRIQTSRLAARAETPPVLALVAARASALLPERGRGFDAFAQLVEVDAVLHGLVARVLSCPVYGLSRPWPPLQKSVEAVGPTALSRMVRSLPLLDAPDLRRATERLCLLWIHHLAVAAATRWLANQGGYEDPDEAYLAGLVHDTGRLVTAPDEESRVVALRTYTVVHRWGLGPRVEAVARWLHRVGRDGVEALEGEGAELDPPTRRLLDVVAHGARLACRLGYGGEDAAPPGTADDADAPAVREVIELELAHAAELLAIPAGPPDRFLGALVAAETEARRDAVEAGRVFAPPRGALRVASVHRDVVDTRGMTAIPDILDRGLRLIHEQLEFDRIVLLEHDPGRSHQLRARLTLDPTHLEFPRGQSGVDVPAEPGGAIQRALETETAVRGGDPDLDRDVLERLGVATFAVAPLRAGSATLGVVVADQFFSGQPVTEADAAVLALLCRSLGLAMENAAIGTANAMLQALSEKDELTGIHNRRHILNLLQHEIDRARRYGKPLSLAMVDVDHFKSWNDLRGHHAGDSVLQTVGQLISSTCREIDSCGRYGGEEFLVVLPETPIDHAMLYAERLRTQVENQGDVLRATYPDCSLTVSIGVSSLAPRGDDAEKMIQRADTALYHAKHSGRNRVCIEVPPAQAASPPVPPPASRGVLDEL